MNEYTIIGIRKFSYTSKRTGENVEAVNVYVTYTDKNTDGYACEVIFMRRDAFDEAKVSVGNNVIATYNRYGNCIGFNVKK